MDFLIGVACFSISESRGFPEHRGVVGGGFSDDSETEFNRSCCGGRVREEEKRERQEAKEKWKRRRSSSSTTPPASGHPAVNDVGDGGGRARLRTKMMRVTRGRHCWACWLREGLGGERLEINDS